MRKKIRKIKEKCSKLLFDRTFIRFISMFIPFHSARHRFRSKMTAFCDNFVYLVSTTGKKTRLSGFSKVPGMDINLSGTNNKIYLYTPLRFMKSEISMAGSKNTIIIEKPDQKTQYGISALKISLKQNRNNRLIHIKKGFSIRSGKLICTGNNRQIIIGKDCLFSANIMIRTTDQHHIYDAQTKERLNPEKDVIIADHVWLAQNVTILKGSIVPPNSIIGTNSIYTASSEKEPNMEQSDGNIYVGSPAKCVRKHISWEG